MNEETEMGCFISFCVFSGNCARSSGILRDGSGERDTGIREAHVAQMVERVLGKDEVTGSIPVMGSRPSQDAVNKRNAKLNAGDSNG